MMNYYYETWINLYIFLIFSAEHYIGCIEETSSEQTINNICSEIIFGAGYAHADFVSYPVFANAPGR
jgi:hypothetical protein